MNSLILWLIEKLLSYNENKNKKLFPTWCYILFTEEELLRRIGKKNFFELIAHAEELAPKYQSSAEKTSWSQMRELSAADFKTNWDSLGSARQDRIRYIAPRDLQLYKYELLRKQVQLILPEMFLLLDSPTGPSIDKVWASIDNECRPLNKKDVPALLAKRPSELTYKEMVNLVELATEEWNDLLRGLTPIELMDIREALRIGDIAYMEYQLLEEELTRIDEILDIIGW
jgi:hypothetical protein